MKTIAQLLPAFLAFSEASAQSYSCSFSNPMRLNREASVLLEHHVNYDEGTFTIRLNYMDGDDSWVGIGVNLRDDGRQMAPSYAVIGDANRGVRSYFLGSNARDGSGVLSLEDMYGHLKSATFFQDGGMSILEFTHDLVVLHDDTGEIMFEVDDESTWIWAIGLPENQWEGRHQIHGSIRDLTLFESCTAKTASPTPISSESQTFTPTDSFTDTRDAYLEPGGGFVNGNKNESIQDDTDSKYPSLGVDASTGQINTREQKLQESRDLWVSHGVLMSTAWGVFVPLAIGAACLRKVRFLQKEELWLCLHFWFNLSAIVFTVFGFIFGLIAAKKDGTFPHFQKYTHHKAGLTVFLLMFLQVFAGLFLPQICSQGKCSREAEDTTNGEKELYKAVEDDSFSVKKGLVLLDDPMVVDAEGMEVVDRNHAEDPSDTSTCAPPPPKHGSSGSLPLCAAYVHRFLGITLLGLAWYACTSGIALQAEKYPEDDKQRLMSVFWGITGCIAGIMFFLGYVILPQ